MKVKLEYLKDITNNNYLGINIYNDLVQPYLSQLREILGEEYESFVSNQQNRDRNHYHITVMPVMDYNKVAKEIGLNDFINSLDSIFEEEFDITLMGLGKAEKNGNGAYFVVVKSDDLNEVRKKYNLPEFDFHITLGFKWKDVFGVRKNQVLNVYDPFLKLLKNEYYKNNERFDFVKSLNHFEDDEELEVEAIKIEDTHAVFRIGENKYYTVSLINDKLTISAKWESNEKKPMLSNTLISRKLKNNKSNEAL